MRVAIMTREYPPNVYGGAGVHVEYLAKEMAKTIDVDVHCWGKQHSDEGHLRVRGLEPPPQIMGGKDLKFRAAVDALALNLAQMKELESANIVHTHTWYMSMAGLWAKKLYNVPFVLTTHSLEPLRAWKAEQLGSGYALSSWIERTAIMDADAVIAVSNGTRADILKAYPEIDPDRIHVIYNGIDLQQYRRTDDTTALAKYGIDKGRPYVLFVGRITRQKGVTHFVDAIPHLPPGTQVVLCAGAPDTPEIAAEMRSKIQSLERSESADPATAHPIRWIDQMVDRHEAVQLYSHCAVFCCPSVYEPFGIINLEAMACKAPVVASATGGILEVVVEGQTGHLVPFRADAVTGFPSDPSEFSRDLATKINVLLADPQTARRFGEAGRKRVEAHFSWTAIAQQTIALYEELI
jgi:alpha-maltose-1-phosphate synthase